MIRKKKVSAATIATTSSSARVAGDNSPTKAVIRICSLRRSATTDPSIASQRNSDEASSSDQMIG